MSDSDKHMRGHSPGDGVRAPLGWASSPTSVSSEADDFITVPLDEDTEEGVETLRPVTARRIRPRMPAEWRPDALRSNNDVQSRERFSLESDLSSVGELAPSSQRSSSSWETVSSFRRNSLESPGYGSPLRHSFAPEEVPSPPKTTPATTTPSPTATRDIKTRTSETKAKKTLPGEDKTTQEDSSIGRHFKLMAHDPNKMVLPETGQPVGKLTDKEFCETIDWEARRAEISRKTLEKNRIQQETEEKERKEKESKEKESKPKGKNKKKKGKKDKKQASEQPVDHAELLAKLSQVEADGDSLISEGSTVSSAPSVIPQLAKMPSTSSVGSKKRPNLLQSLSEMSRRSSTQSTESITEDAVAQAVASTVQVTKADSAEQSGRKASWTDSLRLRKKKLQKEEVHNPLAEKAEEILKAVKDEEEAWREKREHPVFGDKNDVDERQHHYAKADSILNAIGRLVIVGDTWENALRELAEDEKGQKESRDSPAPSSPSKLKLTKTSVPAPPKASSKSVKARSEYGDEDEDDAMKATIASRLARTGWVTDLALMGPKALHDFETRGYDAHRSEVVVEEVVREARNRGQPLLPPHLRRNTAAIHAAMDACHKEASRREILELHPDRTQPSHAHLEPRAARAARRQAGPIEGAVAAAPPILPAGIKELPNFRADLEQPDPEYPRDPLPTDPEAYSGLLNPGLYRHWDTARELMLKDGVYGKEDDKQDDKEDAKEDYQYDDKEKGTSRGL